MTREEAKRYWEVFLTEIEVLKQTHSDIDWEEQEQATKIAIADMEKQIPKKPKEYEDRYYACECGNILLPKWKKYNTELMPKSEGLPHCMSCGQALDWS